MLSLGDMGAYERGVEATIQRLQSIADLRSHNLEWAADAMGRMEEPEATYPGDEAVPIAYAQAMTHDPKGRGFPHLAMRTVLVSAQAAGAAITPQVYEDVKRMAMGPEATDTYLDNCGHDQTERKRRHLVIMGAVHDIIDGGPPSEASTTLLSEEPLVYGGLQYYGRALHTMPAGAREIIGQQALLMLSASLEKSLATDLDTYAQLAYKEAAHYAHIWSHTAWARQPVETRTAFEQYDAWIATLLGSMLLFAAGLDLRKDHNNGEITFKPPSFVLASASLMRRGCANFGTIGKGYRQLKRS